MQADDSPTGVVLALRWVDWSVGARASRSRGIEGIDASADKYHLGHITNQGSTLLRFALGQAAAHAARMDPDLKRTYFALVHRRGRPKAKVAIARKLLVRLFIMLRDQIDYAESRRRGCRTPTLTSA